MVIEYLKGGHHGQDRLLLSKPLWFPRCRQGWVLDVQLLDVSDAPGADDRAARQEAAGEEGERSPGRVLMAAGLSDNTAQLWLLCKGHGDAGCSWRFQQGGLWECEQECLLYSMALRLPVGDCGPLHDPCCPSSCPPPSVRSPLLSLRLAPNALVLYTMPLPLYRCLPPPASASEENDCVQCPSGLPLAQFRNGGGRDRPPWDPPVAASASWHRSVATGEEAGQPGGGLEELHRIPCCIEVENDEPLTDSGAGGCPRGERLQGWRRDCKPVLTKPAARAQAASHPWQGSKATRARSPECGGAPTENGWPPSQMTDRFGSGRHQTPRRRPRTTLLRPAPPLKLARCCPMGKGAPLAGVRVWRCMNGRSRAGGRWNGEAQ